MLLQHNINILYTYIGTEGNIFYTENILIFKITIQRYTIYVLNQININ